MSDLSPQMVIERLDAISRTRALTTDESHTLERAIRSVDGENGIRCTKRDAARAGIKRDMGVYRSRSEHELARKIEAAQVAASILNAAGHSFEAEQVRVLCRTARGLHETAKRLHTDNMALRQGGGA